MPYWQLFYHLVWATKKRAPLLTPEVEPVIHGYLRQKALNLEATVYALNGVEDHVHMVVAIPPKISVAKFVGQVKGSASTRFNKSNAAETPFFWQAEYAVFSVDKKRLPNYVVYVNRQKEHHQENTTIPILERTRDDTTAVVHEDAPPYGMETAAWRRELEELATGRT